MKTKPHPTRAAPRAARADIAQVPRKWRWHYRVLQVLRDHLVDERAAGLAEAAEPVEPHSMDPADSATDEMNHELAVSLLSGEQDALYAVDSAMRRILSGAYGICERTGMRIPPQRLRAVPWTRYTKEAQEELERLGVFHPAALAKAASIQGPGHTGLGDAEEPDKDELQARVLGRHQLASKLDALTRGEKEEPALAKPAPTRAGPRPRRQRKRVRR